MGMALRIDFDCLPILLTDVRQVAKRWINLSKEERSSTFGGEEKG